MSDSSDYHSLPTRKMPGVISLSVLYARAQDGTPSAIKQLMALPDVKFLKLACVKMFGQSESLSRNIDLLIDWFQIVFGLPPDEANHLPLDKAKSFLVDWELKQSKGAAEATEKNILVKKPKKSGNRHASESTDLKRQRKANLYVHIRQQKKKREGAKTLAKRLRDNRDISELAKKAGIELITEKVVDSAIEDGRRLAKKSPKTTK